MKDAERLLKRPVFSAFSPAYGYLKRLPRYANNSLIVVAITASATKQALRMAHGLKARHPRIAITVLSKDGRESATDPSRRALDAIWLPLPSWIKTSALLKATNPGLVLFAGEPGAGFGHLRRAAHRRGCALAIVAPVPAEPAAISALLRKHQADHFFTYATSHQRTAVVDGCTDLDVCNEPAITARLKQLAQRQVRIAAFLRRRPAVFAGIRGRIGTVHFPPIESIGHLRDLLGSPETVMCLGNGPSSEAPGLDTIRFDRLFRVNCSWATRGRFTAPDLVFTNQLKAIRTLRPPIGFVVRTAVDEHYLRWRFRWLPRRVRLATPERLRVDRIPELGAMIEPSTGIIMLATAIALQPKRLIIAGIDLFADKAGAYPGDRHTINEYSIGHDRERECRYIRALLGQYRGELLVFSEALQQLLARARIADDKT